VDFLKTFITVAKASPSTLNIFHVRKGQSAPKQEEIIKKLPSHTSNSKKKQSWQQKLDGSCISAMFLRSDQGRATG